MPVIHGAPSTSDRSADLLAVASQAHAQCIMTAVVPTHCCGAVPDSHRVPSCLVTTACADRTNRRRRPRYPTPPATAGTTKRRPPPGQASTRTPAHRGWRGARSARGGSDEPPGSLLKITYEVAYGVTCHHISTKCPCRLLPPPAPGPDRRGTSSGPGPGEGGLHGHVPHVPCQV
jgi:hypothetical protein